MKRLPVAAFVALVIATVGAFFVTQHLKVTTPLVAGQPAPVPAAFNPVDGGMCIVHTHFGAQRISFRRTQISFYLQHRADDVDVYVLNSDGEIVATLASGRHLAIDKRPRVPFTWDGRESDGRVAPDGKYTVEVALIHQGRTVTISNQSGAIPVTVETHPPKLTVTSVTAPGGAAPAVIPQPAGSRVSIRYTGADHNRPHVLVYRTDLPGPPQLVKSFNATSKAGHSLWDGTVTGGLPAPQGTYLVGLRLTDSACNTARFPAHLPPTPGSTPHAGVTVRYLAAEPPMTPVPAGTSATVGVDARRHQYHWALRTAGSAHVVRSGTSSSPTLAVQLPGDAPALYVLGLRWGGHHTEVPLVASAPASAPRARVLVVLPSLTWQGHNPVDDDGDGLPNTLDTGGPIRLQRVLVHGLPAGFSGEVALVRYLEHAGLRFDLTTDLGLIEGSGPSLTGRHGVVLAGSERWVPQSLGSALSTFVERGGHVLSLGIDALRRGVTVSGGQALDPTAPHATDDLLARPGPVAPTHGSLILVDRDDLHIFTGTSMALRGYRSYQLFAGVAAPAAIGSAAGVSNSRPAIIGYRLGHGDVVDIGLPGFASTLSANVDAQTLLANVWRRLRS